MRFLMLNWRDPRNPEAGGAERVSWAHMQALTNRGHEVYWFANHFPNASSQETIDQVRVRRGGSKGVSLFAARRWYREQPRFDLVIDQHHGLPWLAPWWTRTRCVAYIHEVLGPIWSAFFPWPISVAGRWQERWMHWLYRRVTFWTVSESTRRQLLRHGVREVMVFPNGIDVPALPHLESKPITQPLRLIVVSRLAPNKRIDHAIRALDHLRREGITAHLTIVGGGNEQATLRDLTRQLALTGRIQFTGPVPEQEKHELLSKAHVLLHPSLREGWGLNVIEANAMGTPAVVYPVAGLVDSTVDRITGLHANRESPEAMAECLAFLIRNPADYDTYRAQAWERAKELHWSKILPRTCDWLEEQARA